MTHIAASMDASLIAENTQTDTPDLHFVVNADTGGIGIRCSSAVDAQAVAAALNAES